MASEINAKTIVMPLKVKQEILSFFTTKVGNFPLLSKLNQIYLHSL